MLLELQCNKCIDVLSLLCHVPTNLALLVARLLSCHSGGICHCGFLQAIGTRIKLAHALAQQWFGVFITPDSPADGKPGVFVSCTSYAIGFRNLSDWYMQIRIL